MPVGSLNVRNWVFIYIEDGPTTGYNDLIGKFKAFQAVFLPPLGLDRSISLTWGINSVWG